jgi:hypothetical protein
MNCKDPRVVEEADGELKKGRAEDEDSNERNKEAAKQENIRLQMKIIKDLAPLQQNTMKRANNYPLPKAKNF